MDSLNSLLIGFYTLLSYSYSQRHKYLPLGAADVLTNCGVLHENRKEKTLYLSFFTHVDAKVHSLRDLVRDGHVKL